MDSFNLNDIEQVMTIYLAFNFIIAVCLIYLVLSVIFRIVFKNKTKKINDKKENKNKKKRKKDIIEFFWNENDKDGKEKIIFKRIFLIVLIIITSIYLFNSIRFIIENIETVKKVLKIE